MVEGLLESMAEYYSVELSQKVARGRKESLMKGKHVGGAIIFGYDKIGSEIVINDTEAKIVKEIFERYKNGEKMQQIINWLKSMGIKTKKGKDFTFDAIAKMLRNKKYIGKTKNGNEYYDNVYPQIIDNKLFECCGKCLGSFRERPYKAKDNDRYLLSNKMFCGSCGAAMTADRGTSETGKSYTYYKCSRRKRDRNACDKKAY